MALSSNSTMSLSYEEEFNFGVIPVSKPNSLRNTGESLKFTTKTAVSEEIDPSRQVGDSVIVDADCGGGVNFQLSYQEYDKLLSALMSGSFTTYGTGGVKSVIGTIDPVAGTITGTTGDFTGISVGQMFSISGSAANDNAYLVASNTGDIISVDASTPFAAASTSETISVSSTRMEIATVSGMRSFSMQTKFSDVNQFFMYTGMVPKSMSLDISAGKIVTGAFDFIGKNAVRSSTTQFVGGAPTPSFTYGMINSVTGVGMRAGAGSIILRDSGGADLLANTYILSLKVSIDAGLRARKAVSVLGNADVGLDVFSITGTVEIYLADGAVYDEALANRSVSMVIPIIDEAGNGYGFTFQHCKLGVPPVNAGSKNSDTMLTVPFTAVAPSVSTDKMLIVDRFGAAIV